MLIKNNTSLDYSTLGQIIDSIIKNNKEDTHYVGQVEGVLLQVGNNKIVITIRYLKRYVEWIFNDK